MARGFARFRMPETLWSRIKVLIPEASTPTAKGGRPRIRNLKPIADGIFYKLRTGCQWNAVPRVFGPSSTIHLYFQRWVEIGIFERMWELALREYDQDVGIEWRHQSLDTATVKSPLGGEKNRRQSHGSRQAWQQTLRARGRAGRALGIGN